MSGPVPSPSMNGMMGWSGTWSFPSTLRIGLPAGTVTMENAGMRRSNRKAATGSRARGRRARLSSSGGGRRLAAVLDEGTERLAGVGPAVVAAGEHLLQPHVQDDEE